MVPIVGGEDALGARCLGITIVRTGTLHPDGGTCGAEDPAEG